MKRSHFLATSAAVVAIASVSRASALTVQRPLGEAAAFPGFVLRAFEDGDGEFYLAYSASALVAMGSDGDYAEADFTELHPNSILTNAGHQFEGDEYEDAEARIEEARERCNGACRSDDHECFVVRDKIEAWVREIDSGEVSARWAKWNRKPFHPETMDMVDQLWTYYN